MVDSDALTLWHKQVDSAWHRYQRPSSPECIDPQETGTVVPMRQEIIESWQRCSEEIAVGAPAPLDQHGYGEVPDRRLAADVLIRAVREIESELVDAARDSELALAVTDPGARILWSYSDGKMRTRAEKVNFVPDARWDEASVGTNALDLALRLGQLTSVFSAEHFNSLVHPWSCWAVPITDKSTGAQLGVLDLSVSWERTSHMGRAAVRALGKLVENSIAATRPRHPAPAELVIRVLGTPSVTVGGAVLRLSQRQLEILLLLALHPDGLRAEQLYALLYEDDRVSMTTLKSEVSRLRSALGGMIDSRPYRLMLPYWCDVTAMQSELKRGDIGRAITYFRGELLETSESPALVDARDRLTVALREALLSDPQPEAVLRYVEYMPHDTEIVRSALDRIGGDSHPARALLMGAVHTNL